ncbi:NAD-dependent epimerase/dehydratase family protein [Bdellovibrio bacteriovorus]|uniref:Capsular polysaccharide synthesis enzyme Cap5F n=1 Tax=Bdellovibrio bacteriovorus (strain ATCC 15356 / DSM 50701 / NCIMB 9529 / HD100) TaxID=264462 RepID=Q6MME1_BDEBA|nr:NAD-dependent epimerase/dehydratase family protein [Bdellovibrio bacteriovorus]CAE79564.1 capsular polysaccharide synthesis enzyme Cap5F [Bdellovibrio bacteriovorus HD100]
MKVLITGSQGFLGKNLIVRLRELKKYEIVEFNRENTVADLPKLVGGADFVFHLAGVNRPQNDLEFKAGNADLTQELCRVLKETGKSIPVVYASSIQAELENAYGQSKKAAEDFLLELTGKLPVSIYRLPNIFGKWSRPNYNSAVATFCHNISQGLPIAINNPDAAVTLVYVDDVVSQFLTHLEGPDAKELFPAIAPTYKVTVGELARQIEAFKESRSSLVTEAVGAGLVRALHATYLSFLKPDQFAYSVPRYGDNRGVFVEMLKTKDSGQFSFFTAHPGITRGGHYHHSKTEKFLVLKGKARYRFRHIVTKEFYELDVDAVDSKIVETIPGWSHDITNIGNEELVVMLWANEIFDRAKPDTVAHEV